MSTLFYSSAWAGRIAFEKPTSIAPTLRESPPRAQAGCDPEIRGPALCSKVSCNKEIPKLFLYLRNKSKNLQKWIQFLDSGRNLQKYNNIDYFNKMPTSFLQSWASGKNSPCVHAWIHSRLASALSCYRNSPQRIIINLLMAKSNESVSALIRLRSMLTTSFFLKFSWLPRHTPSSP